MEIRIKEIINYEEYESELNKYLEDSQIRTKPEMEFVESIVGLIKQEIISYRILSRGMVEPDKQEIKIIAENGQYITNYSRTLHEELKQIIEDTEKYIEEDRTNKFKGE